MSRLGDFVKIHTGKLDANASSPNGKYPFFTCAVEPLKINSYSYDCECVLLAGNGDLNVKYYNGKFDAYQRTYVIESLDKEKLLVPYLYYFMERYVETLRRESIGGVIKYIKLGNITEAEINVPDLDSQTAVIERLRKLDKLFQLRKTQLAKLDELVKARFVEMFGDVQNTRFELSTIGNECKLKSGTTFSSDKEFPIGDYPYIKVSDMNLPENEVYIKTSSIYVSAETAGATFMEKGAVIFPKRGGAIGTNKKRILYKDTCADLNIMGVIPGQRVKTEYLYVYFQRLDLNSICNGSTVPQINNKDVAPLQLIVPPLELQERFAAFLRQSEKLRLTIRQGLYKMETLKRALMHEYFG